MRSWWYLYTIEYHAAITKKEIPPFVTAWMGLEIIMLYKISKMEKDKCHMISVLFQYFFFSLFFNSIVEFYIAYSIVLTDKNVD